MIKKYKEFLNEGLIDHLSGPNEDEIIDNLKGNPEKLFRISLENFYFKGIKLAIELGVRVNDFLYTIDKQFDDYSQEMYDTGIISYLIDNKLDISHKGYNVFKISCYFGYYDLVEKILNMMKTKPLLNNVIWQVAMNGHLDVVKLLEENGADIHVDNDRSLLFASSQGHLDVVEYLLTKNPSKETIQTSIEEAEEYKHPDVVELLKNYI